jgi:hypothetical protein
MRNAHPKEGTHSFAVTSRNSSISLQADPSWPSLDAMMKQTIDETPETELERLWSVNYKEHLL